MIPTFRTLFRAGLCALPVLAGIAAPAKAADLAGAYWKTNDGKFVFRMVQCGEELCGDLVWMLRALDRDTGEIKRDIQNDDPALRDRLVCGLRLVSGLEPDGENEWNSGRFYNPDDGNTYGVSMEYRPGTDRVDMRVYLGVSMLGLTMRLTRVDAPTETCEGRAEAAKADIENYMAETPGSPWVAN